MSTLEQFLARKRHNAAHYRARHGEAWKAYHLDRVRRKRARARAEAGQPPTRTDRNLPPNPIPCPSSR